MSKAPKKMYQALLAGNLSNKEVEEMKQELKSKSSQLEKFIENRDLDVTESEIYSAFDYAIPNVSRYDTLSESEADEIYRKILSSIDTGRNISHPQPFWRNLSFSTWLSFALGAAVASLVIFFLPMVISPADLIQPKEGILDKPQPERIRLMFNIGKREKGRPIVIERGVPGEKYRVENDVLIRYEIRKPGYVCMTHYLPSGKMEVLNKDSHKPQKAGWHEIKQAGRVKAVALDGLPGKHSFYGIFSNTPLECPQAAEKVVKGLYGSDTVIDSFSIEVE
jgi:hypothetical protein